MKGSVNASCCLAVSRLSHYTTTAIGGQRSAAPLHSAVRDGMLRDERRHPGRGDARQEEGRWAELHSRVSVAPSAKRRRTAATCESTEIVAAAEAVKDARVSAKTNRAVHYPRGAWPEGIFDPRLALG